jgi:hypothetical protein
MKTQRPFSLSLPAGKRISFFDVREGKRPRFVIVSPFPLTPHYKIILATRIVNLVIVDRLPGFIVNVLES